MRHVLGLLLAGMVLVTAMCGGGDPRKYPTFLNTGSSFEDMLVRFTLALPRCEVTDLVWADVGGPMSSGLYLTYRFPQECFDEFVVANRLGSVPKEKSRGDLLPFSPGLPVDMGWPYDATKTVDLYEMGDGHHEATGTVYVAVESVGSHHVTYIKGLGE